MKQRVWIGICLSGSLFCLILITQMGYPWSLLLFHGMLLLAWIGGISMNQRIYPLLASILSGVMIVFLMMIYGYGLMANHLWGRYISFEMIGKSWEDPSVLWKATMLCEPWIQVFLGFLFCCGAGGIVCLILEKQQNTIPSKWWSFLSCLILLFPLLFATSYESGEPISRTFHPRVYPAFPEQTGGFRQAVEDAAVRKEYPISSLTDVPNIVLIIVDALRPDRMSVSGHDRETTPFLNGLKAQGQIQQVQWAFASCSHSLCGIASTLSSRKTCHLGVSHFSLHHLLKKQGYEVNFFLSGEHEPIYYLSRAHRKSIDRFADGISTGRGYEDQLVLDALKQLEVDAIRKHPQFFYLHLMSAHSLGKKEEQYQIFSPDSLPNTYDNGVRQADAYLEQIWTQLRRLGILENAMIVFTADHGEGLGEHGVSGHGHHVYPEQIQIPLLIVDSMTYQNLFFARQVDVAATIVNRIGMPLPAHWEGRSLLEPLASTGQANSRTLQSPGWCSLVEMKDSTIVQYLTNELTGEKSSIVINGSIDGQLDFSACPCGGN